MSLAGKCLIMPCSTESFFLFFTVGTISLQSHLGKPNFKGEPSEKKQSKPIFKARFWKPNIKANFQRLAFRGQTSKPVFNGEPLEKNHQSRFPKQVFGDQASKPIFNSKPLEGNMNPQIPCRISTHMKTRAATCKTDQKRNIGLHRQGEACR